MRKVVQRLVAAFFVILMFVILFPFQVFAVDPVSAATMANALAQAITAYGASQGVSMMYDVTDKDSIGEGVHDLWTQFKTDINDNDVPTYDSLAVTSWSTIYKKVGNSVAINLSETTVSYLDRFWNWLLSGPAEMTKVDNQYYEWTMENGQPATISVYQKRSPYGPVPYLAVPSNNEEGFLLTMQTTYATVGYPTYYGVYGYQGNSNIYAFVIGNTVYMITDSANVTIKWFRKVYYTEEQTWLYNPQIDTQNLSNSSDGLYYSSKSFAGDSSRIWFVPSFESLADALSFFADVFDGTISIDNDDISVKPYPGIDDPGKVYIPDNDDVNYQPLPYLGPLNIPWHNSWGDGQTLDDADAKDIADALDQQIVDDGTLKLEGDNTVNPPAGEVIGGPDDYQVPGLADVFPFCIPFDIYNFLSALAAEPAAPHFQAQLDFPEAVGGTQTIDLDFDTPTFNQLAQLLRLLELLAFIVGLALLTRSMFIRG